MLNDLARPARWMVAGQLAPVGLLLGAVVALTTYDEPALGAAMVTMLVAVVLMPVWLVVFLPWLHRADRRLRDALEVADREVRAGEVRPTPTTGRVVRTRRADRPGWVVVVCTALVPEGPRRVAALAPYPHLRAGDPVALWCHPVEREAAVLDGRVGPGALADVAADPRWRTRSLPTDRAVAGGWGPAALAGLLGLAVGAGVSLLVVALG